MVAVADPAAEGSRFPPCLFHVSTGLWCPGCGLTRATHHLLRGDVPAALATNVFTPLVIAAIVAAWWAWLRRAAGRPTPTPAERLPARAVPLLAATFVVYGVARNLPFAPFDALAP